MYRMYCKTHNVTNDWYLPTYMYKYLAYIQAGKLPWKHTSVLHSPHFPLKDSKEIFYLEYTTCKVGGRSIYDEACLML